MKRFIFDNDPNTNYIAPEEQSAYSICIKNERGVEVGRKFLFPGEEITINFRASENKLILTYVNGQHE